MRKQHTNPTLELQHQHCLKVHSVASSVLSNKGCPYFLGADSENLPLQQGIYAKSNNMARGHRYFHLPTNSRVSNIFQGYGQETFQELLQNSQKRDSRANPSLWGPEISIRTGLSNGWAITTSFPFCRKSNIECLALIKRQILNRIYQCRRSLMMKIMIMNAKCLLAASNHNQKSYFPQSN